MASHVPELPVELITLILEQVGDESRSTLFNAALCSHQFYDITIPLLYRRIDIGDREESDAGKNYLKKLLLHFLRKPELARHVHHFSIRPAFEDGLETERDRDAPPTHKLSKALDLTKDLEDEIQDAIVHASHSRTERVKWLEEIDLEDALLALLLPKFTNLLTLDLEILCEANSVKRMLERVARNEKPFDKEPTFTHLHSITWVHCDESIGGSPVGVVFMFPSVQSIYLYRNGSEDVGDDANKEFSKIKRQSSSCTELEARDCRFNNGDIEAILSIPKSLRTFIYEIGWGELSFCSVSFAVLREALEHHKNTLENLSIDYIYGGIEWLDDLDDTAPMASFKDFSKLRRLHIAPDFVFGADSTKANDHPERYLLDLLPRSLEFLHIKHGNTFGYLRDPSNFDAGVKWEVFFQSVHIVLSNRDDALPSLRQIIIDTTIKRIKESRDQFSELLDLANCSNVELIVQNNFNDEDENNIENINSGENNEDDDSNEEIGEKDGNDENNEDEDKAVERKWGMNEDIEWKECSTAINTAPPFEIIQL